MPRRLQRGSNTSIKVLSLLDLFTPERPAWTVDMIVEELSIAKATAYRYIAALHSAGFLINDVGSRYVLGPRFVEIDRVIRLSDPLLHAGLPVMSEIRNVVNGSQLLCRFYGDRVLTIHEDRTDNEIRSSYQRGRPFPLLLGAPSRIVLAFLGTYAAKNLFLTHQADIRKAGLGGTWSDFRDWMKRVRKEGVYIGSEVDKTLVGVAAPILATKKVVGCLCLVRVRRTATPSDVELLVALTKKAANEISGRLSSDL